MDHGVRQQAHRLSIPWPWRGGPSSDGSASIEPPAEALGRRGGTRSLGLQRRVVTPDEGSPHFERHWRFADSSSALGPCKNREHSEISRSRNKGRPNRGLSGLRSLTLSMPTGSDRWRLTVRRVGREKRVNLMRSRNGAVGSLWVMGRGPGRTHASAAPQKADPLAAELTVS